MSKTFKANPTNDKHNLKKRILEIESNPTTTTSSTVTKITSGDVGNGSSSYRRLIQIMLYTKQQVKNHMKASTISSKRCTPKSKT
jgi:hypothetical protein